MIKSQEVGLKNLCNISLYKKKQRYHLADKNGLLPAINLTRFSAVREVDLNITRLGRFFFCYYGYFSGSIIMLCVTSFKFYNLYPKLKRVNNPLYRLFVSNNLPHIFNKWNI